MNLWIFQRILGEEGIDSNILKWQRQGKAKLTDVSASFILRSYFQFTKIYILFIIK